MVRRARRPRGAGLLSVPAIVGVLALLSVMIAVAIVTKAGHGMGSDADGGFHAGGDGDGGGD